MRKSAVLNLANEKEREKSGFTIMNQWERVFHSWTNEEERFPLPLGRTPGGWTNVGQYFQKTPLDFVYEYCTLQMYTWWPHGRIVLLFVCVWRGGIWDSIVQKA